MEFKLLRLEDLCTKITDGSHASPKGLSEGYLMYSVKDMQENKFNPDTAKKISEEDFNKLAKNGCKPEKNDVVIAKDGSYLKHTFVIDKEEDIVLLSSIAILRPNTDKILSSYLSYYLKQQSVKAELKNGYVSGSVLPRIVLKDFKKLPIKVPNLKEQESIVSILEYLDQKVLLNNSIVTNLEELSQTLFKRWFVDFEFPDENGLPYTSSNKSLEDLPPLWEKGSIDNIGTIIAGGTPSKKIPEYFTDKGISWLTPKDLSNNKNKFIYKGENDITELGLQKSSAKLMPKDTVLFSSRAPIGYIALAGKEMTTNQGFKSIIPNKGYNSYFIYFLLKNKLSSIEKAAGGSTFKEISGKSLKQIEILIPPKHLVCEFEEIVSPYFEKIKSLELENNSLIELRDTLLPKLMSGEIELPDTLEVIEDAELLQRG